MFDPYHKWLGVPEGQRPPTYYQLLGISPQEADMEVIKEAALRQTSHIRTYQMGPHAQECTQVLNEIAQARAVLLNPADRTEYDARMAQGSNPNGHADQLFLDQYLVLDRIGKGRMAGVYKAVDQFGQTVAIKILPPSKARDPRLRARFRREADLACRLEHPNVVRAFRAGEADGLHYLVMEYLEGVTLQHVLELRGRLSPEEAVHVIYQALRGLQHLHKQGLVHGNLEPANLMLVRAGGQPGGTNSLLSTTVKIIALSLSRSLCEEATDIRADIYSLGCILYHCVAGVSPHQDARVLSQGNRHATGRPRPLKEFNAEVPDALQLIVDWMMAKDPAARYSTPERAAEALHLFLSQVAHPRPRSPSPLNKAFGDASQGLVDGAGPFAGETVSLAQRTDTTLMETSATSEATNGMDDLVFAPYSSAGTANSSVGRTANSVRRDWLLLVLGGLGVLIAEVIAWLLVHCVHG
jgi:serine/threonine protein kinase